MLLLPLDLGSSYYNESARNHFVDAGYVYWMSLILEQISHWLIVIDCWKGIMTMADENNLRVIEATTCRIDPPDWAWNKEAMTINIEKIKTRVWWANNTLDGDAVDHRSRNQAVSILMTRRKFNIRASYNSFKTIFKNHFSKRRNQNVSKNIF